MNHFNLLPFIYSVQCLVKSHQNYGLKSPLESSIGHVAAVSNQLIDRNNGNSPVDQNIQALVYFARTFVDAFRNYPATTISVLLLAYLIDRRRQEENAQLHKKT